MNKIIWLIVIIVLALGVYLLVKPASTENMYENQGANAGESTGGEIGDPCDPATYTGPYQCLPDPNSVSGYAIVN